MKNLILLFFFTMLFFSISCSKDEQTKTNAVIVTNETTQANSEITYTSIKISGNIAASEGIQISSRGVCWSTNPNPTINDNVVTKENNVFSHTITTLIANTIYYYRIFAITADGITYSDNESFSTLSLDGTFWKFSTFYPPNNFLIESKVDFYENGTTKFDEIGPGQGFFTTYGTWLLTENTLTYIWEGNNPNNSTYVYTGTMSGMTINGTYTHPSISGTWSAELID